MWWFLCCLEKVIAMWHTKDTMISKFFTRAGAFLAVAYIGWFVYERFICSLCWGNDLFFSIPFMALVPASFEGSIPIRYLVVCANAILLWLFMAGIGKMIACVASYFKKA